jgi:hypothetical protein
MSNVSALIIIITAIGGLVAVFNPQYRIIVQAVKEQTRNKEKKEQVKKKVLRDLKGRFTSALVKPQWIEDKYITNRFSY